jgi:hypothetical protein
MAAKKIPSEKITVRLSSRNFNVACAELTCESMTQGNPALSPMSLLEVMAVSDVRSGGNSGLSQKQQSTISSYVFFFMSEARHSTSLS